jgi:hypothetical protein
MLNFVLCEVRPGLSKLTSSAGVKDVNNVPTYIGVDLDFIKKHEGQTYLPIGTVYRDREKGVALIEFPYEAESGAHRIWVPLSSLLYPNGMPE